MKGDLKVPLSVMFPGMEATNVGSSTEKGLGMKETNWEVESINCPSFTLIKESESPIVEEFLPLKPNPRRGPNDKAPGSKVVVFIIGNA
jgi:hypothetical protein